LPITEPDPRGPADRLIGVRARHIRRGAVEALAHVQLAGRPVLLEQHLPDVVRVVDRDGRRAQRGAVARATRPDLAVLPELEIQAGRAAREPGEHIAADTRLLDERWPEHPEDPELLAGDREARVPRRDPPTVLRAEPARQVHLLQPAAGPVVRREVRMPDVRVAREVRAGRHRVPGVPRLVLQVVAGRHLPEM
jgi:hypothetical protein